MPLTARDRKAELVRRGITMASIARGLGVTLSHVQAVVSGKRRAPRVENAVAEAIGMPVEEVFEADCAPAA